MTSNHDIDKIIALARVEGVTIATFGDMTRVPGSTSSLLAEQAAGRSVEIVYSPLDALKLAQENPDRQIVFVGVGFETTTPLVAMAVKRAKAAGLDNFSVYGAHKNMPGALEVIINDPELKVDALILPGHVSTIIGVEPLSFPGGEVRGAGCHHRFEPVDVLQGIAMIMRQLHEGRADIEIAYSRGVMAEGNPLRSRLSTRCSKHAAPPGAASGRYRGRVTAFARSTPSSTRCAGSPPRSSRPSSIKDAVAATSCAASCRRTSARCSARCARLKTLSARAWCQARGSCAAYYRYY